ncbi:hypothetical protein Ab1vBOLIVR2_gp21 [Agrobacterium phage OLIVR2]|uniref:Uncharacterized protein n=1 Tax=Agrobacterium phage OLIVR1 TaxID=2723769 RepID=A0A858MR11_9CAUD|nr:hypothetical protein KNU98_gp088 [Agrobacterium phage OLIVR1]QIW87216.1 hypothetical protein Ab1vBOLIVR1_gp21 [Agrobacterium phage OLIVR1]QIW87324.1 hypothetical protein Ab1vBOLIVR2_gp21 [Agrobacterium phage OLIVR2]QIW87431.1 hypothetical protein Ab1vBOLIVR3_gp21 [Agrobacterium phage OLIVR3]
MDITINLTTTAAGCISTSVVIIALIIGVISAFKG